MLRPGARRRLALQAASEANLHLFFLLLCLTPFKAFFCPPLSCEDAAPSASFPIFLLASPLGKINSVRGKGGSFRAGPIAKSLFPFPTRPRYPFSPNPYSAPLEEPLIPLI